MKRFGFKTKKAKIIFFSILGALFVASSVVAVVLLTLAKIDYVLADNLNYELKAEASVATLFAEIRAGTLETPDETLDTSELGEKTKEIIIISPLGTKQDVVVTYNVTDGTPPTITGDEELTFRTDESVDILSHYLAEDNSGQTPELSVVGEYDSGVAGEYTVKVVAKDASGNETVKEVKLVITEPPRPVQAVASANKTPYYIEVNRQQNVVIVYALGRDGEYSNIAKVFVASTGAPGSETPLGTFTATNHYETLYLVGDVWGHWTVRINGPYFFHSVPYYTKGAPWDNLEYLEYNKLGNGASAGCVRLAAADAKWIYDNIDYGTTVHIYDSDTLPSGVVKPSAIKIDENSPNRGWDPTDPDPENPWH